MNIAEDVKKVAELPYDWSRLDNSSIMISGGTGFLGSFLIDVFRYRNKFFSSNIRVVSLSRHKSFEDDETVRYTCVDVRNSFSYSGNVDYILHLASNTHPKQYAEDPVGTITTNVIGCDNLLRLGVSLGVKRFLMASSVEIYGQGLSEPVTEDYCGYINCNEARSGYNESKRVCESLVQAYRIEFGIDSVVARLARVFGPDDKMDTKAMSQFIDQAVNHRDVVLKSDGNQRYSFVYVADAVAGLLKVLLDGSDGEAYNISDDDEGLTLGEYAGFIARLAGKRVVFEHSCDKGVSKATYALMDCRKIKTIGWSPLNTVREGLVKTYNCKSLNCSK